MRNFLDGEFDLPKLEEKVLAYWREQGIFEKSLSATKKGKPFTFYEGPPYANGRPGIHHVLARVVKDVILRYKTMRGYHVPRRAGWDTHGLPVEIAAEKTLGLKSKRDIEKFGIKLFNEKAKEQVWIYKDEWERLTRRIGYWLDLENAYVTYTPEYIETIWWTLSAIWKRKLLYKGHKVVPWCPRCGTALSSHELAQGYKEVVDNSVYVKFKLKSGQRVGNFVADDSTYILSWTTTPWTLPGNLALAVGEDIPYAFVRTTAPEKASYIIAKDLAAIVLKDSDFAVLGEIPGRRLTGLEYEPLFKVHALQSPVSYKVYAADFVTTSDGTGVVHTAVMYGEDDYALGKKIGLPERHTVDEEGKFTADVAGFAGLYVKAKETEEKIFGYLRDNGNLFSVEAYSHEYPHCWRCGTPILYYARDSWFIAMGKLRDELIKRNKGINWMPAHVKAGRFGEWLREKRDWNLSRERYWGAPLPIWECRACGNTKVIEGLQALSNFAGGSKNHYWVMRHGEAESNIFDVLDSGQRRFLHLTPRGKKQAEASVARFKRELKKRGERIDVIISSDITRTKDTEKIALDVLEPAESSVDKRIEEIHLGPSLTGYRDEEYKKRFPTYETRFADRPQEGESLRDLRTRMWSFMADCEKKYKGKNILIVSHEYPIWMLTGAAEGWSEKRTIKEKEQRKGDFIGFAEIRELNVLKIPRDETGEVNLHRPFADTITAECGQCGKEMKRVSEVADVWYDSGAMPLAQQHFPFAEPRAAAAAKIGRGEVEASALPQPQKYIAYPADYISEGMDQTRGWFYTMLAIGTALGFEAPYKNVIALGLINDKFGQKMSKSKGNIVEPFPMIEKYGVDALRWYFYSNTPLGEPKNFDEQDVAKVLRKVHLIVYNSFVFWRTYAGKGGRAGSAGKGGREGAGAGSSAAAGYAVAAKSKNILDKWILSRLAELVAAVSRRLDNYEIREASLEMENFVDDLSRWYIRRSRRRLQKPESAADYKSASATLGYALYALTLTMAPFTPFFSEIIYFGLGGKKESVHLEAWPKLTAGAGVKPNADLAKQMAALRTLAAEGLAKRAGAGIKVRQPLASLAIGERLSAQLQKVLADEVNVKKILIKSKLKSGVELDTAITPELRNEGILREVVRMAQELRQKAGLMPKDSIALLMAAPQSVADIFKFNEKFIKAEIGAKVIEYRRSDKFSAEEETKIEGEPLWLALRKVK